MMELARNKQGEFYFRKYVGGPMTYHFYPSGERILAQYKVSVGHKISNDLFQVLKNGNHIFTGKGGVELLDIPIAEQPQKNPVQRSERGSHSKIAGKGGTTRPFSETDVGRLLHGVAQELRTVGSRASLASPARTADPAGPPNQSPGQQPPRPKSAKPDPGSHKVHELPATSTQASKPAKRKNSTSPPEQRPPIRRPTATGQPPINNWKVARSEIDRNEPPSDSRPAEAEFQFQGPDAGHASNWSKEARHAESSHNLDEAALTGVGNRRTERRGSGSTASSLMGWQGSPPTEVTSNFGRPD
jgi:hypothetical protein